MDEMERIQNFELVKPGSNAKRLLRQHTGHRYMSLDLLKKDEYNNCAWCEDVEVTGKRRKYCSDNCSMSADIHCYPQSPTAKLWRFVHVQGCACASCGVSFEDQIRAKVKRRIDDRILNAERGLVYNWDKIDSPVSLHFLGNNTGDELQVDHIIPISRGGVGVGIDNVQVLCVNCHKAKTAREAGDVEGTQMLAVPEVGAPRGETDEIHGTDDVQQVPEGSEEGL